MNDGDFSGALAQASRNRKAYERVLHELVHSDGDDRKRALIASAILTSLEEIEHVLRQIKDSIQWITFYGLCGAVVYFVWLR